MKKSLTLVSAFLVVLFLGAVGGWAACKHKQDLQEAEVANEVAQCKEEALKENARRFLVEALAHGPIATESRLNFDSPKYAKEQIETYVWFMEADQRTRSEHLARAREAYDFQLESFIQRNMAVADFYIRETKRQTGILGLSLRPYMGR